MSLSPHDPFSQVPVQATGLILKGDFLIYDFFILTILDTPLTNGLFYLNVAVFGLCSIGEGSNN